MNNNKLKYLSVKKKYNISPNLKKIKLENEIIKNETEIIRLHNRKIEENLDYDIDLAISISLSEEFNISHNDSKKFVNKEILNKSFEEELTSINDFDCLLKASIESLGGNKVIPNQGGGDCLFHTLSKHLDIDHMQLRNYATQYISINWNKFKDFALHSETLQPFESSEEYVTYMSKSGSWGDHLSLIALCELYQINAIIIVVNKQKISEPITINVGSTKTVLIKFNSEFHYEAIV